MKSMHVLAYVFTDLVNTGLLDRDEDRLVLLVGQLTPHPQDQSRRGGFFPPQAHCRVHCHPENKEKFHWSAHPEPSSTSNELEPDYLLYNKLSQALQQQ